MNTSCLTEQKTDDPIHYGHQSHHTERRGQKNVCSEGRRCIRGLALQNRSIGVQIPIEGPQTSLALKYFEYSYTEEGARLSRDCEIPAVYSILKMNKANSV